MMSTKLPIESEGRPRQPRYVFWISIGAVMTILLVVAAGWYLERSIVRGLRTAFDGMPELMEEYDMRRSLPLNSRVLLGDSTVAILDYTRVFPLEGMDVDTLIVLEGTWKDNAPSRKARASHVLSGVIVTSPQEDGPMIVQLTSETVSDGRPYGFLRLHPFDKSFVVYRTSPTGERTGAY